MRVWEEMCQEEEKKKPRKSGALVIDDIRRIALEAMGLLLDTLDVAAVAGINLDFFALVDEERHTHLSTRLDGSVLEGVGCGITLDAWFGVGHFEGDNHRGLDKKDGIALSMHHEVTDFAFLEVLRATDEFLVNVDLLKRLLIHEVVTHLILIDILIRTTLDAHVVDFDTGVERLLDNETGHDILEFGANESRTLAWLHVKELDNVVVLAVELEAHTVFNISSFCHKEL